MHNIFYSRRFVRQLKKMSEEIRNLVYKKTEVFRKNNNHPSLKTHKLQGELGGLFSFSVDYDVRIVFKYGKDKDVFFLKIGNHDIYK